MIINSISVILCIKQRQHGGGKKEKRRGQVWQKNSPKQELKTSLRSDDKKGSTRVWQRQAAMLLRAREDEIQRSYTGCATALLKALQSEGGPEACPTDHSHRTSLWLQPAHSSQRDSAGTSGEVPSPTQEGRDNKRLLNRLQSTHRPFIHHR